MKRSNQVVVQNNERPREKLHVGFKEMSTDKGDSNEEHLYYHYKRMTRQKEMG